MRCMRLPIVNHIKEKAQSKTAMNRCIQYCIQEKKTIADGKRYVTGVNCYGLNAYKEFMTTKYAHGQDSGRYFYQYIQSFSPEDDIDYDTAHKIAIEFAEKAWQGHEVLVSTHCDREHIHSHFIINSVSFENGKKLRQSPNTLVTLRTLSDEICEGYGIKSLKPYDKTVPKGMSNGELKVAEKGQSWKMKLAGDIDYAMSMSGNKEDFIKQMNSMGYQITWTDDRKYITYTCPGGRKCSEP